MPACSAVFDANTRVLPMYAAVWALQPEAVPLVVRRRVSWLSRAVPMDPLRPEDTAMGRYADGDDSALAVVYDALAPRLYGFFVRRARDAALCEDLLQQTFLNMHRGRATFSRGSLVTPWAFAIARRLLIDSMRSRARVNRHVSSEELGDVADDSRHAEVTVLAKELGERARVILQKIPESQREAFYLIRVEGLSMVEAAEVLNVTVSAVKLRAHRAYEALGLLNEEGTL